MAEALWVPDVHVPLRMNWKTYSATIRSHFDLINMYCHRTDIKTREHLCSYTLPLIGLTYLHTLASPYLCFFCDPCGHSFWIKNFMQDRLWTLCIHSPPQTSSIYLDHRVKWSQETGPYCRAAWRRIDSYLGSGHRKGCADFALLCFKWSHVTEEWHQ